METPPPTSRRTAARRPTTCLVIDTTTPLAIGSPRRRQLHFWGMYRQGAPTAEGRDVGTPVGGWAACSGRSGRLGAEHHVGVVEVDERIGEPIREDAPRPGAERLPVARVEHRVHEAAEAAELQLAHEVVQRDVATVLARVDPDVAETGIVE